MKLSIITINYNNHCGLRKTIESVVNQTYKEFQYIIIDGGSTDGSVEVIKEFADQIDYWVSEPDRGIYHAMNKGIDKAIGEYSIFMNSGDFFYNFDVVKDCIGRLDGTSIVTGNTSYPSGNLLYAVENISLEFFFRGFSISHPSTFIFTMLLKKYKYDEHYKMCSDWKFWIQVLIKDDVSYKLIDNIISVFDTSGISSQNVRLRNQEHNLILEELFSERILNDYRGYLRGYENRLYDEIKHSKIHKIMYSINVLILKTLLLFRGKKSWASKFPIRLRD